MEPGKLYKASKAIFEAYRQAGGGRKPSVSLYYQSSPELDRPLHHYYLYPETDKAPLLFLDLDCLIEANIDSLGSRFYIWCEGADKRGSRTSAGKFLHEDRVVWVMNWELGMLTQVQDENQVQSL